MIGIVCSIGSYTQHTHWLFYTAYALHTQLLLLDIILSLKIEYSPKFAGRLKVPVVASFPKWTLYGPSYTLVSTRLTLAKCTN